MLSLRANADLTGAGNPAIGQRIYGRRTPDTLTWPFVRVNVALEGPLRKGTTIRATVHSFSKAEYDDEIETINALLAAALEDAVLELSPAMKAYVTWISSQTIEDSAEAGAWHGINSFSAAIG